MYVIGDLWDGGTASYLTADVHNYPDIAAESKFVAEGMLNGDKTLAAFLQALPYCATDSARPVLTGVHFYLGDVIQVAGADGFRVSFQSINTGYPWKGVIIIPRETVETLEFLWKKSPAKPATADSLIGNLVGAREFKLVLQEGAIRIEFGDIILYSRLIEGTPPDVLNLLNGFKEPIKVTLLATDLQIAVLKLGAVAKEGSGMVRLQWTDSRMTVSAGNQESGEVSSEFKVLPGSQPGRIALNINYILDYVTGKEGFLTMGINEPGTPAVFHYGNKPIVAIMPMAANWGDKKPEKEAQPEEKKEEPVTESDNTPETVPEPSKSVEGDLEVEGMEETETGQEDDGGKEEPVATAPSGDGKKPRGRRKKKTK